ncbi:hypothetical protein ACQLT9_004863 [Salmonella enterica subsp. diarizonae]
MTSHGGNFYDLNVYNLNAERGTLSDVHILNNCQVDGTIRANQIEGDIAKTYVLAGNSVYIPPQVVAMNLVIQATEIQSRGNHGSVNWDNADLYFDGGYQDPKISSTMSNFIEGNYSVRGGGGSTSTYDLDGRLVIKVYSLPAGVPKTISCSRFAIVWMSKA